MLGGPCPQTAPALGPQYACNADRIVSRVYTLAQEPGVPAPSATPLISMPEGTARVKGPQGAPARVFLDGERLWVAVGCLPCRVASEELWVVELPLADDADLTRIQLSLGLPRSPVLRAARAWQEVIDERRIER